MTVCGGVGTGSTAFPAGVGTVITAVALVAFGVGLGGTALAHPASRALAFGVGSGDHALAAAETGAEAFAS